MEYMELADNETMSKLIVKTYTALLSKDEKRKYLAWITAGEDPRDLIFWHDIRGLYPKPKLRPPIEKLVVSVLKEQLNEETV
jgi:hypothetical protein